MSCLQRNGKVYEVQVDVVQSQIGERPPARRLHVLLAMVGVPQLARHKDLLSGADPSIDGPPVSEFSSKPSQHNWW